MAIQQSRLDELESQLATLKIDNERLDVELRKAVKTNIENAEAFQQQIELHQEELEKVVGNAKIRVPVRQSRKNDGSFLESLFGINASPSVESLVNADYQGFLLKRGEWLKRWEPRYFILAGGALFYFDNSNPSTKSNAHIELVGCKIVGTEKMTGRKYSFGIFSPNKKSFMLAAKDEPEAREWVKVLRTRVAEIAIIQDASSPKKGSSSSSSSAEPTLSPSKISKKISSTSISSNH